MRVAEPVGLPLDNLAVSQRAVLGLTGRGRDSHDEQQADDDGNDPDECLHGQDRLAGAAQQKRSRCPVPLPFAGQMLKAGAAPSTGASPVDRSPQFVGSYADETGIEPAVAITAR